MIFKKSVKKVEICLQKEQPRAQLFLYFCIEIRNNNKHKLKIIRLRGNRIKSIDTKFETKIGTKTIKIT